MAWLLLLEATSVSGSVPSAALREALSGPLSPLVVSAAPGIWVWSPVLTSARASPCPKDTFLGGRQLYGVGPALSNPFLPSANNLLQIRSQPQVPGIRASTPRGGHNSPHHSPTHPPHTQTFESRVSCSTDVCTQAYTHTRQHTPLSSWLSRLSQQGPNDQEMNKDTPPGPRSSHWSGGGGRVIYSSTKRVPGPLCRPRGHPGQGCGVMRIAPSGPWGAQGHPCSIPAERFCHSKVPRQLLGPALLWLLLPVGKMLRGGLGGVFFQR